MSILRSRAARGAFAAATIMVVSRTEATVTQVDGTIVPVTSHLQAAIDTYELPTGSIDAVKDAAEQPQIFRPRLTSPVVFLDMREGAGFENSFGWYNVSDDVSTAAGRIANLHPVTGGGVAMVNRPGDPAGQACTAGQCGLAPRGGLVTTGGGCSTGGDGSLGAGLAMLALLIMRRRPRRTGGRVMQTAAIVAMLGALLGGCKLNDVRASSEAGDAIAGATSVPQLAAAGGGILAVAYQNQQSGARAHILLATSIDTGATWTYTEFHADGGAGEAILPQIIASQVGGKPAAVTAWTDFRANQINGDVYAAVSH